MNIFAPNILVKMILSSTICRKATQKPIILGFSPNLLENRIIFSRKWKLILSSILERKESSIWKWGKVANQPHINPQCNVTNCFGRWKSTAIKNFYFAYVFDYLRFWWVGNRLLHSSNRICVGPSLMASHWPVTVKRR